MSNELIVSNLQVLLKEAQSSNVAKDRFRANAYRKAIKAISNLDYPLESGKDALELAGVGKKIAEKIQEIIDTGELHQVEELGPEKLEKTKVLTAFNKIWGVGPVKAATLWDAGARSIADISKNKKLQGLLNDNQKVGLKYYEDLQKRIPRWQVDELKKKIMNQIRSFNTETGLKVRARVCGSYRRKAQNSGDMDLLITEETDIPVLNGIVDKLTNTGIIIETLGLGPSKYMGIVKTSDGTAFRLDIEAVKMAEWPFALVYFTGSGGFNEKQRQIAKKKGYSLSEHGMKDVETGVYAKGIKNERDIFDFLGMKYLAPWDRKG